jgi:signal recognition particle GTPase
MAEGLTYETKSQAETAVEDYKNQGLNAKVIRTTDGRYRVLLITGMPTEPELVGDALELEKEEREFEAEERKERRRATSPREIARRKLEAKKHQLERTNAKLERLGMEKGTIVEVRDPETYEVIDYKLERRDIGQRAAETISRKVPEAISELPQTGTQATGSLIAHTSRQINVKKGMRASIPGQAPEPKAVIAWLPEKTDEYIGAKRARISKIGTPDPRKIGIPYLKRK